MLSAPRTAAFNATSRLLVNSSSMMNTAHKVSPVHQGSASMTACRVSSKWAAVPVTRAGPGAGVARTASTRALVSEDWTGSAPKTVTSAPVREAAPV